MHTGHSPFSRYASLALCLWFVTVWGGCDWGPSDEEDLVERYGSLAPGTFAVDQGRNAVGRSEGCTRYEPPRSEFDSPRAHLITQPDSSGASSGYLIIPDLLTLQEGAAAAGSILFEGKVGGGDEGDGLWITERDEQSARGVFTFEVSTSYGVAGIRMEGGFQVRFSDLYNGEGC